MSKFFRDGASRKKFVWGEARGFCTIFLMLPRVEKFFSLFFGTQNSLKLILATLFFDVFIAIT